MDVTNLKQHDMKKIVIDVEFPNYGRVELNIDKVIAVVPSKNMILFDSVYWKLNDWDFDRFCKVWSEYCKE